MTTDTPWVPSRTRPRRVGPIGTATPARPTAVRALAAITLLGTVAALYGVTASSAFALAPAGLTVHGGVYTDEATVRRSLGLDGTARPNLFALDSARLGEALRSLPTIDGSRADAVSVRVALPDRLIVDLHERQPIMAWQVGDQRFLVDIDGVVLAEAAPPEAGTADVPDLPVISDTRASVSGLHVGGRLDPVDLRVARLIGAVTPAMLGSGATSLGIVISDEEGYVLRPADGTWRAVFGIFTPHGRGADLVSAQVQCLASLLHDREDKVAVAYLFPEGGRCGTWTRSAGAP